MEPWLVALLAVGAVLLLVGGFWFMRRSSTIEPLGTTTAPPRRDSLRDRLGKTRLALGDRLNSLLGRSDLDGAFWDELEESLIAADMGVAAADRVVTGVRRRSPADGAEARQALTAELLDVFAGKDRELDTSGDPGVVLIVGVNGSGKTTTIAKLAAQVKDSGKEVLLGSADTFRAAADTQLRTWADRVGVAVVGGGSATDPASVAFDAFKAAQARSADVLIVDTAGRLQAKANLMEELKKIARVLEREAGRIDEVLLVVDGTSGQNAMAQAKSFAEAVSVTGLVLTKLDGSPRGGIAVAIEQELGIPVKFIGVGEGIDHLVPFEPAAFVDALVGE